MQYYGYIYQTTNLVNGKKYIGQHKVVNDQLDEEYLGSGINLTRAIQKYGKDNFSVELIEWVSGDKTNLDDREIYWIQKTNAVASDCYYNIASGGQGGAFAPYDEVRCKHLSEANLRYAATHVYPEWKKLKQSKSLKQHYVDNPYKKKKFSHKGESNGFYGRHHTEETKQKIRDRQKVNMENNGGHGLSYGVPKSDVHKKKLSDLHSQKVFLLDSNNDVLMEFKNCGICGDYFNVSGVTITNYIKSGKLFRNNYLIIREEKNKGVNK